MGGIPLQSEALLPLPPLEENWQKSGIFGKFLDFCCLNAPPKKSDANAWVFIYLNTLLYTCIAYTQA